MEFVPIYKIYQAIDALSDLKIDWILIRNSDHELPERLRYAKDIDILVAPRHLQRLEIYLNSCTIKRDHPALKFCMIEDQKFKLDWYQFRSFSLDICDTLYYCNLERTKFYPISKVIYNNPWSNEIKTDLGTRTVRLLDQKNYLIVNILNCILWKRHISSYYMFEFNKILQNITEVEFNESFYPFFADYSEQIYQDIVSCNVRDTIMKFHQHLGSTKCIPYNLR